jgi:hypothetical protein
VQCGVSRGDHNSMPESCASAANASDAGGSLAGSCPRTNARHQFVIELQMWELPPAAAGFVVKTLHSSAKLVASIRPIPSTPVRAVASRALVYGSHRRRKCLSRRLSGRAGGSRGQALAKMPESYRAAPLSKRAHRVPKVRVVINTKGGRRTLVSH